MFLLKGNKKDTETKNKNVGKTNLDSLNALNIIICDIHICNHIYPYLASLTNFTMLHAIYINYFQI